MLNTLHCNVSILTAIVLVQICKLEKVTNYVILKYDLEYFTFL